MTSKQGEPIAIVGSGCRFPGGANSPSSLWKLIESPRDVCVDIPPVRFDPDSFYHPVGAHHGTTNVRRAYLLEEDVRAFDAAFFNISPNEADSMDPQQRILLETVYEALEAGGHPLERMRGSDTAVYVGTMTADFNDTLIRDHNTMPKYFATGTNRAIISNRVSYFFDWHGPSLTLDTACSSSLIAVHLAIKSLRGGEARAAVACGTQVILNPETFISESKLSMLSASARCRMWDAGANGYARGEGVAAVVLKKLSDAIADGDHIESIIRETGANQDGFSNGITVPSTEAQAKLIRETYARAGLDPENNPQDRPQFFEAHGTGTKAGDPKEAAAIHKSLGKNFTTDNPLYVGSFKTIIGHLEGGAGLAGLLKGNAMVQNGSIPPNLLFERLNPDIEPFYKGLHLPTKRLPWPKMAEGTPRRVSVNSFGFGGSNAHAILEQYRAIPAGTDAVVSTNQSNGPFAPFVFSAASEITLVAQLQAYSNHLKAHPDINISDLAFTLQSRRSHLSSKIAFSARTAEQLITKLDAKLKAVAQNPGSTIGSRSNAKPPRVLGVFTGQGAQWSAMGAELIRSSAFVRGRIQDLEDSLAALPPADRPEWSLQAEMLAGNDVSRLSEAALSQPLCTAIQVALVDLLRSAGVEFSAVVGHSSGEIAAAYTAGFVSATDAIRIAYYRGLYAKLAGSNNQKGAMMAVGTSWEDAQDLVNLRVFKGRLAVAAHNSAASVTISGDADALAHAEKVFVEEKKFARMLKVDTAYHSHHMYPCGDPYVNSLRECGVRVIRERENTSCNWFSSVVSSEKAVEAAEELQDIYWKNNMTNAVLFSDAVKNAVSSDDQLNLVIEVGPHPALQGPASQNITEIQPAGLPYSGVLSRGKNDIEIFSDALGFFWTHFPKTMNFQSLEKTATGGNAHTPQLMTDLPKYQFNHGRIHWSESRVSKKMRSRKLHHEVLGFQSTDSNARDLRWNNVLKPSEISWLSGHQLQGQMVFPAAGYVAMALEASKVLAGDKPVELFELHNLLIPRAITFEEEGNSGVETLVTLTGVQNHSNGTATADFACYSTPVLSTGSEAEMELVASGSVKIVYGKPDVAALPCSQPEDYNMATVEADPFYATLKEIGYGYYGPFRTMSSIKRRLNQSSVLVDTYGYADEDVSSYMVHPSMLDVAFQAAMLAYSAPGDERLWSLSVPTAIGTIRVNPELCASLPLSSVKVPCCAALDNGTELFSASIDIFGESGEYGMIQIEDLMMKTFAPATKADDRVMFTKTIFDTAVPNGPSVVQGAQPSAYEVELANVCERISYYYIRKWKSELSDAEWASGQAHWVQLSAWVNQTLSTATRGQHPTLKKTWSKDSVTQIQALAKKYSKSIDVKLLTAVGENLPAAVRGETTIEENIPSTLLDDWYKNGLGFATYNSFLADTVKQVTHRYPNAKILEIGAGAGGATESVLRSIGDKFSTYTYTDASADSLTKAAEKFATQADKVTFKALDIETSPATQGFEANSYDIVIASNALHATASLQKALENARLLLRPGGYLLLNEITGLGPVRFNSILGSVPSWWAGVNDGRKSSPLVAPGGWNTALRKSGFGGIDSSTPEIDRTAWPFSIIASQAVNDKMDFLRQPLAVASPPIYIESLVILGNESPETARIGDDLMASLGRFCGEITVLNSLPTEEEADELNPMSTFLNLVDLDSPIFQDFTAEKMGGLGRMIELAKCIVWVTQGAWLDQAYHMGSIAFTRTIKQEAGHISFNHLDISDLEHNESKTIAEYLLQTCALEEWEAPPSVLADRTHRDFEFLWSKESEVLCDRGQLKLPRLVENIEQNNRINSSRRTITKKVPISSSNVAVFSASATSPSAVVEQVGRKLVESAEDRVRVETSSLLAVNAGTDSFLFVGVGKGQDGSSEVILTTNNACETNAVASVATPSKADADSLLVGVTSELIAESLLEKLSAESHILVHCSGKDRFLAAALSRRAAEKSIRVTFTCDNQDEQREASWIQLSARNQAQFMLRRMLRLVKLTHFIDFTAGASPSDLSVRIAEALPADCTRINTSALFRGKSSSLSASGAQESLEVRLQDAVDSAQSSLLQVQDLVTPLEQIRALSQKHATSAVSWPSEGLVEVEVRPIDAQNLFSKNKTYLLIGLTGQIGQAICEWMVSNGAGHVYLTSRNPKIDQRWLDSFKDTGATVKGVAMDVLNKSTMARTIKDLQATCPPIAGIVNGAMILNDQVFANMTAETMQKVLAPKIDGTINLDSIFEEEDLDFFIVMSSAACVLGNAGQSAYTVANGFLGGIARQRRRRGLAASAVDIGRVIGIGVIMASGQQVLEQLKKLRLAPISEIDFRSMMAETIQAGWTSSEDPTAIPQNIVTTGLGVVSDDEEIKGPWFSNALYSHLVKASQAAASGGDDQGNKASLPVTQQLAMAASSEEAAVVLQESFTAKLRIILQLKDQVIDRDAPLVELGIDSLVAVEIRSWFLKELKVDIPVLKIIGGASLAEISSQAVKKLPEGFVGSAAAQDKPAAPAAAAKSRKGSVKQTPAKAPAPVNAPAPVSVQEKVVDSETSSASGNDSGSDLEADGTPRSMTTVNTPSSGSVSDPTELDTAKSEAIVIAPKALERPARKVLKSERMSLPQSRFWFLRHLLEDPTTSNVIFNIHITGDLRISDLERAIRIVTKRHEALRTMFTEDENDASEAYQKVLPSSALRLEHIKIESEDEIGAEYTKLRGHIFDLEDGDTLRMTLLTHSSTSHFLLINYHHIVMDGASFNVFVADLEKAYMGQSLGAAPRQYPEYSVAQRKALENGEMGAELKYWFGIFPGGEQPPVLPLLPMARTSSRITMKGFDSHQVETHISPELVAAVRNCAKAQRCTPFHLHLAAFKAMLFALGGESLDDLTIGIADAARNDPGLEGSIGFFLNLLTLRFRRQADQTFANAIVEARDTVYGALSSSRLPFDILLTELKIARSSSHSPFFQAFLDYRQGIQERHPWGNCQFEFQQVNPGRTAYDITLDVADLNATETIVAFRVQKSLYDLTAANLLLKTYVHFLETLTADNSISLKGTPLFSEAQLSQAVKVGRGPNLISDWVETLPHRIDQVAEENKDKVALMDGHGKVLTYSDMINRIEAIGEELQKAGVGAGSRVLVYQQPAADWPCSMLAIMRTGGIYVPLDLRNPMPRLAAVAKDCAPTAVLVDYTTLEEAPELNAGEARIINVSDLPLKASTRIANYAKKDANAAILYTSGSTGTPKGIMVTHAGLRNEIEGYTKTWGLGAERVLQQSAFTFNHSSDQMYTGLVNGGMVYIVPAEQRGDPLSITQILKDQSITYTKATPSEYSLWKQYGGETLSQVTSWRNAFGGGEQLTSVVTQEFADLGLPSLRFLNSYGPTEISISSHKMVIPYLEKEKLEAMGRIPCGYSLPNYYTYVVDEKLRPMPVGMPGEICIGGAGVSLGYLNNAELTSKHFVDNPFATPEDVARGFTRMYKTGDIGHLQEDGAMVFHNRMAGDSQVKIRGLRIELSDIESNIIKAARGELREAVVTLRDGDSPFLVAHVVFSPQHSVQDQDKDEFLAKVLKHLPIPQYMIPLVAIPLEKFPLSNHSKVDRKAVQAMPLPERVGSAQDDGELTETMIQLKRVWQNVLGKNAEKLGFELTPSTDFFLVGGNSLLFIRLQAQIRQAFNVVIPLAKLLGASTLKDMSRVLEESASVAVIDWEQETAPPTIPSFLKDLPAKSKTQGKTILLTGATGYLCKFLLPHLAASSDIETIHCVAVREKEREREQFTSPKVVYHAGDLGSPLLGLSEDEFRGFSSQVDAILHVGATRSFWDNYQVLRPSNVDPTKELVKLAAPNSTPIHYISTSGVLPSGTTPASAGSAATFTPPTDGSEGYIASKWASERVLERSTESLGVPSIVYRFFPATQQQAAQKQELLDTLIRFVDASGAVPEHSVWTGRVDLIPAQQMCTLLCNSVTSETAAAAGSATYFSSHESPVAVNTEEMKSHIGQARGGQADLKQLPVLSWFGRIKALGFDYILTSQEATIGGESGLANRR